MRTSLGTVLRPAVRLARSHFVSPLPEGVRADVVTRRRVLIFPADFSRFPDTIRAGTRSVDLSPASSGWIGRRRPRDGASWGLAYDFPRLLPLHQLECGRRTEPLRIDSRGGLRTVSRIPGGDKHPVPRPQPRDIEGPAIRVVRAASIRTSITAHASRDVTLDVNGTDSAGVVSYLGTTLIASEPVANHPGVFLGTVPCPLAGVLYPSCTVPKPISAGGVAGEPANGKFYGPVIFSHRRGRSEYHAMKLSFAGAPLKASSEREYSCQCAELHPERLHQIQRWIYDLTTGGSSGNCSR